MDKLTTSTDGTAGTFLAPALAFLAGGGELGALCRTWDWSRTTLGPAEAWPQSLKTAVSMTLTSTFPTIVLWGPELVQIYNDAYRLLMGSKHPAGLGQPTRDCWPEVWHINQGIYPRVFAGETLSFKEAVYPLAPDGVAKDYHLTLCYNPIRAENGDVGGVLVTVFDVTGEVRTRSERDLALAEARAERARLYEVFMQAPAVVAVLEGPEHRFKVANPLYLELIGGREVVGKTLAEALPEAVDQGFDRILDEVRRTGTPFVAHDALVRLDRKGTGELDDVYVDFVYQPLRDGQGQVHGVMAHAVETTGQVLSRKRIESLAAEREAMLSAIADGLITYDTAGRITFMNDAALRMMPMLEIGKSFSQMTGRVPILQLDGTPFPQGRSPSGRALQGERVVDAEWLVRPDGEPERRLQGSAMPVRNPDGALLGVVVTCRDVTEEHRLRRQLELERNRLNEVFLQAPAAIMVSRGPDHVIEAANPVYAGMTGDRPLIGKTLRAAFPDLEGQGLFELYDQVLQTGKPYVGNERAVQILRRGKTEEAYFNFVYQPLIDEQGAAFGVMTHAVEVSEVVRARQHVEQRNAELVRLTSALERSNRELDQFAYVASHDLKSPLRGIANLAQWVQDDAAAVLSEQSSNHLKLLLGRVHRMETLIDGILAYSRAGRVRDPVQLIDTGSLVDEVLDLLAPRPGVTVEVAQDLPSVKAEKVPLQQVFLNLIGNAIKFGARGRDTALIRVGFRDAGSEFVFSVSDDGPGIAPEFHERIWTIFQTLESRDKIEGTGIGLSVVQKIVESRGGRSWLESAPGQGATFFFTWPK